MTVLGLVGGAPCPGLEGDTARRIHSSGGGRVPRRRGRQVKTGVKGTLKTGNSRRNS